MSTLGLIVAVCLVSLLVVILAIIAFARWLVRTIKDDWPSDERRARGGWL